VFALLVGASMVIIDMGRPDRVLNVVVHGRLQSPILWDLCSIMTYVTGSLLYLYVAMIPDMPLLARRARERGGRTRLAGFYDALGLGYRGTPQQERRLNTALGVMAVIIIPVAVSVHTVVSWVFGMTLRPGWHSTIFGPYFVVGAIFSGTAAIITAMAVFRRAYRLERYLTLDHFRKLALLLLALTLLYVYFTLSEYLTVWYGGKATEARMLALLMGGGTYGALFWGWAAFGLLVPLLLLLVPSRRSLAEIVTASVLINIGMWIKRYLIVVPTLETPYVPAEAGGTTIHYFPTWIEWAVTAGALAAFLLLFTLFSRLFPIVSIWETAEDGGAPEHARQPHAPVHTPVHGSAGPARGPAVPAAARIVLLLLAAAAALGLAAGRVHAQHAPATPAAAAAATAPAVATAAAGLELSVEHAMEDGEAVLLATVLAAGVPVEGVRVGFYVRRLFGDMHIGDDTTLDDGTAAVAFPADVPAGADGMLAIRVRVLAPREYEGAAAEALVAGGTLGTVAASGPAPRALWSERAPVALVAVIGSLLFIVWSIYVVAIYQLVRIRSLGKEAQRHGTA
jgi:Ni/Fe-hydrogenase subunit HybB-like protein